MARSPVESLTHYYLHGYNLINPVCRIILSRPGLKGYLDSGALMPLQVKRMVVREILIAEGMKSNSNAMALIGLETDDINMLLTGNTNIVANNFILTNAIMRRNSRLGVNDYVTKPEQEDFDFVNNRINRAALDKSLLDGVFETVYGNLLEAWNDAKNVKIALRSQKRPPLAPPDPPAPVLRLHNHHIPTATSMLRPVVRVTEALYSYSIRGDSAGMLSFLKSNYPVIKPAATSRFAQKLDLEFTTNQPFSTSQGDVLASVAGKSLIWIIRSVNQTTAGRLGGQYASEAEVLYPHNVVFALEGLVCITSEDDVERVNLSQFSRQEILRAKMKRVYLRNRPYAAPVCFLIAHEAYELA